MDQSTGHLNGSAVKLMDFLRLYKHLVLLVPLWVLPQLPKVIHTTRVNLSHISQEERVLSSCRHINDFQLLLLE